MGGVVGSNVVQDSIRQSAVDTRLCMLRGTLAACVLLYRQGTGRRLPWVVHA